jgi:hypothetical protein
MKWSGVLVNWSRREIAELKVEQFNARDLFLKAANVRLCLTINEHEYSKIF